MHLKLLRGFSLQHGFVRTEKFSHLAGKFKRESIDTFHTNMCLFNDTICVSSSGIGPSRSYSQSIGSIGYARRVLTCLLMLAGLGCLRA